MKRWFVIRTKRWSPDKDVPVEVYASTQIVRQGFDTLCPMIMRYSLSKGRRIEGHSALFPKHIFARFDARPIMQGGDNWVPIRNTRGVAEIISDPQGNPIALRDKLVDAIRKRDGEIDAAILKIKTLSKNDRVRIEEGPFRDWVGLFERRDAHDRVRVLLDILGRETSIMLAESAISAVA